MKFTFVAVGIPILAFLAVAIMSDSKHPSDASMAVAVPAFIWLAIGIRATRQYWRARWRARGWMDEKSARRGAATSVR